MAHHILIVESDPTLSHNMRAALEARGFTVQETSDGKGSIELIRGQRPGLVMMEVDLSAGQNGYILCGKLKKDDDLKAIPILIVGNPDGFAQHRKLKTRADEYVAKPVDTSLMVENVGKLIGFPEVVSDMVIEESVSFSDLMELNEEPVTESISGEEIQIEEDASTGGDPELDLLDQAFESATELGTDAGTMPFEDLRVSEDDSPELPREEPAPKPVPFSMGTPGDSFEPREPRELRGLRARVAELESALSESQQSGGEQYSRIQELEELLSSRDAELETAGASVSDGSKEQVFALRAEANVKAKESLRLKADLHAKDQEISDLHDKVLQLEQQLSEGSGELARKDAQMKTLQTRADQLVADRKRFDYEQLLSAREEARTATSNRTTLQAELEETRERAESNRTELDELRHRIGDLESHLRQARDEADEHRSEAEQLRGAAEMSRLELDELRGQLEQAQLEMEGTSNQLNAQANAFAEDTSDLRRRVAELEESTQKNEDRVAKFYAKIKDDEKVREKTRKALAIAMQLLDEQQQARIEIDVDVDVDEPAEA